MNEFLKLCEKITSFIVGVKKKAKKKYQKKKK